MNHDGYLQLLTSKTYRIHRNVKKKIIKLSKMF